MASPLAQFEIKEIFPITVNDINISFTNSSLAMLITALLILLLLVLGTRKVQLVPNKFQTLLELSYEFISDMINDNIGKEGKKYLPFIFSIFLFILIGNLLGMLPFSFTWTSHIIVTFAIAFFIFIFVTILAILKHGIFKFLGFLHQVGFQNQC